MHLAAYSYKFKTKSMLYRLLPIDRYCTKMECNLDQLKAK